MKQPLKSASQILHGNNSLQRLLRQAETLSQLQSLVHRYLAPAAREQLQLGNYEQGVLTLVLADAAWATRLRYQQEQLVRQLAQHAEFASLQRIRLKIRPPAGVADADDGTERRYLSGTASEHIRHYADSIDDPQLRAALQRLAGNVRKD